MTREAPPGISPQWYILTAVTADSVYPSHDRCSPRRHHAAWNEAGNYAVFFADPDGIKPELVPVP